MHTCLVTQDADLVAIIRHVVPDLTHHRLLDSTSLDTECLIVDLAASPDILLTSIGRQRTCPVFVVGDPDEISALAGKADHNFCPLLKPLDPITVRAFLDLAENGSEWKRKALETDQLCSDRDALIRYVLAASLRLQGYEQQRTNFLARALHDLRAPLTALPGYCGLLAEGQLGALNGAQRDLLNRMQSSARRIAKQAADIFELSVVGTIRRKPNLVLGDIEDVVAQAIHEVSPLAQERNLDLSADVEPPEQPIYFEPDQIVRALTNLLENCCRFAPAGGYVQVRGYSFDREPAATTDYHRHGDHGGVAGQYRIEVLDNGPAIQPELLSSVFEEYTSYRGGRDRSGGGLGLAICKMIVTAHDGSVSAANTGAGTVFSICLPCRPADRKTLAQAG